MTETMLTIREVARELRVGRNAVYTAIRCGQLRAVQLSARSMRVRRVDLESYLQRRGTDRKGR